MTVFLSQTFSGETPTPQAEVSGVSLTGTAGTQTIQSTAGTANTFDATAFAVGKCCHITGMSSGDGAYRVTARGMSGAAITVTPEGTTYSRSIPTFVSSNVVIRTGCRSTDIDTALGSMQESTQDNPTLCRIIHDPVYGSALEKLTPKLKTYSENNGWQFIGDLSTIGANGTELWMGYWVLFRPGTSYGTLTSGITASSTSISFTLTNGDIYDFPVDTDAPYVGTVNWNSRECAMYVLLGDTDSPGQFETVGYQSRSGSGPYTLTLASSAWRGLEGTTAKSWPIGTRITIGFDFNHGFKMPGVVGGSVGGTNPGVDYCQARPGYVNYDYDQTPDRLGSITSYCYNYSATQTNWWWWGKEAVKAGYTGGQVYYKQNQWQCIEFRVVMDSPAGGANGILDGYLDGVHIQNKTNTQWRGASATFSQWEKLLISTHWGKFDYEVAQKDERMLITGLTIADAQIDLYSGDHPPYGVGNLHAHYYYQLVKKS